MGLGGETFINESAPTIQHQIKMTGCGKTHLVLEMIEKEYNKHFDYIVIICPTLQENDTYHAKGWIENNNHVWLLDSKDNLYQWIKKLPEL